MADAKSTKDWTNNDFVQAHIEQSAQYVYAKARSSSALFMSSLMDSPLEVAFSVWWRALVMAFEISEDDVHLAAQRVVDLGEKTYRLDFALEPNHQLAYRAAQAGVAVPLVCVELDGHDFHERTKAQVAYRNQRDRDLSAAGWRVLHFSGSEMHRDPRKCVLEAYKAANAAFSWDWECSVIEAESAKGR